MNLFAQDDPKIAFAYGIEMNGYSMDGQAYGMVMGFDFDLPWRFAGGINLTASTDYSNSVLEPSVFFRFYVFNENRGLFAQADLGFALMSDFNNVLISNDNKNITTIFLIGLRAGYRFPFGRMCYAEPYVRAGYPFFTGAGFILGYRR